VVHGEARACPRCGWRQVVASALEVPRTLAALAQRLRDAPELVSGSHPTVAQALLTPEASILQRVVHDSRDGGALRTARCGANGA
jgi:glutathione S-transferase